MRIFGLNRRIIRVLLGSQYAHMLEYRAEIALWALSGVLPFIMLSVWSSWRAVMCVCWCPAISSPPWWRSCWTVSPCVILM